MRSLTSDNEGALPTLTRGRPRVTETSQNVTLGVTCHEAEAGKESPANIVTRTESGLMLADNKDITENDSRRVWMWIFYVWEILCLWENLNIFLFIQKGYDSLSNIGLRCLFFIFYFLCSGWHVLCKTGGSSWSVSHLSGAGVITCHHQEWSPHDHSNVGCRHQFIVV